METTASTWHETAADFQQKLDQQKELSSTKPNKFPRWNTSEHDKVLSLVMTVPPRGQRRGNPQYKKASQDYTNLSRDLGYNIGSTWYNFVKIYSFVDPDDALNPRLVTISGKPCPPDEALHRLFFLENPSLLDCPAIEDDVFDSAVKQFCNKYAVMVPCMQLLHKQNDPTKLRGHPNDCKPPPTVTATSSHTDNPTATDWKTPSIKTGTVRFPALADDESPPQTGMPTLPFRSSKSLPTGKIKTVPSTDSQDSGSLTPPGMTRTAYERQRRKAVEQKLQTAEKEKAELQGNVTDLTGTVRDLSKIGANESETTKILSKTVDKQQDHLRKKDDQLEKKDDQLEKKDDQLEKTRDALDTEKERRHKAEQLIYELQEKARVSNEKIIDLLANRENNEFFKSVNRIPAKALFYAIANDPSLLHKAEAELKKDGYRHPAVLTCNLSMLQSENLTKFLELLKPSACCYSSSLDALIMLTVSDDRKDDPVDEHVENAFSFLLPEIGFSKDHTFSFSYNGKDYALAVASRDIKSVAGILGKLSNVIFHAKGTKRVGLESSVSEGKAKIPLSPLDFEALLKNGATETCSEIEISKAVIEGSQQRAWKTSYGKPPVTMYLDRVVLETEKDKIPLFSSDLENGSPLDLIFIHEVNVEYSEIANAVASGRVGAIGFQMIHLKKGDELELKKVLQAASTRSRPFSLDCISHESMGEDDLFNFFEEFGFPFDVFSDAAPVTETDTFESTAVFKRPDYDIFGRLPDDLAVCKGCSAVFPKADELCPSCGFELDKMLIDNKESTSVEVSNGSLLPPDGEGATVTEAGQVPDNGGGKVTTAGFEWAPKTSEQEPTTGGFSYPFGKSEPGATTGGFFYPPNKSEPVAAAAGFVAAKPEATTGGFFYPPKKSEPVPAAAGFVVATTGGGTGSHPFAMPSKAANMPGASMGATLSFSNTIKTVGGPEATMGGGMGRDLASGLGGAPPSNVKAGIRFGVAPRISTEDGNKASSPSLKAPELSMGDKTGTGSTGTFQGAGGPPSGTSAETLKTVSDSSTTAFPKDETASAVTKATGTGKAGPSTEASTAHASVGPATKKDVLENESDDGAMSEKSIGAMSEKSIGAMSEKSTMLVDDARASNKVFAAQKASAGTATKKGAAKKKGAQVNVDDLEDRENERTSELPAGSDVSRQGLPTPLRRSHRNLNAARSRAGSNRHGT